MILERDKERRRLHSYTIQAMRDAVAAQKHLWQIVNFISSQPHKIKGLLQTSFRFTDSFQTALTTRRFEKFSTLNLLENFFPFYLTFETLEYFFKIFARSASSFHFSSHDASPPSIKTFLYFVNFVNFVFAVVTYFFPGSITINERTTPATNVHSKFMVNNYRF